MRRADGFTIIELMIVMTVIGILSAVAIPVYQGYVTRSKVAEALYMLPPFRTAVEDRFVQSGQLPADNASLGASAPGGEKGRYVRSIQVVDGAVILTFGDAALLDRTITFTPTAADNKLSWRCTSTLPDHLKPKDCG